MCLIAVAVAAACSRSSSTPEPPPAAEAPAPPKWLKGQLHAHTDRSGDSHTAPDAVAAWYKAHGYDFLVVTDHNSIGGLSSARTPPGLLVLRGVELTTNLRYCEPPEGTEPCLLHVNALAVADSAYGSGLPAWHDHDREHVLAGEIAAARSLGGIPQLNHPNFHYAASAEVIAKLAADGPLLVEFENRAGDSMNDGDSDHPAVQELWNRVLALGATVYGTATDDAHHYADAEEVRARGQPVYTGDRGFVMVHAAPTPSAIRDALGRGDFYASTGVVLEALDVDDGGQILRTAAPCELACIDPSAGIIAHTRGRELVCRPAAGQVLRAIATDDAGRHAWTQAVRRH